MPAKPHPVLGTKTWRRIDRAPSRILKPYGLPLATALIYAVVGLSWVFLSNLPRPALGALANIMNMMDGYHGWVMVGSTAILLFVLLERTCRWVLRSQQAAMDSMLRVDHALKVVGGGVWERNLRSGEMVFVSSKMREMIDAGESDKNFTKSWRARIHPDDWPRVRESVRRSFQNPEEEQSLHYRVRDAEGNYRWYASHGRVICDQAGVPELAAGILLDITSSMEANQRIQQLLHYDELTALPNRRLLTEELDQAINANRSPDSVLVVQMDIDNFKGLNSEFGVDFADRTLGRMAERLQKAVSLRGFVARSGADEFTIFLKNIRDEEEMQELARAIRESACDPVDIAGQNFQLSVSAGATVYPTDGNSASQLLSRAEVALTKARSSGGNQLQFYERGMNEAYRHRTLLANELRRAIAEQTLDVHYQPILKTDDLSLISFEALARWDCPGYGPISPAIFIPLAEEIGLIGVLSRSLMRQACAEAARWNDGRAVPLRLAVNVSPIQLASDGFVEEVTAILEETGLSPHCLILEITESTLMENTHLAHVRLGRLKEMGIGVAIDDFGTGYSSLALLRKLPVTELKIDRSFIRELEATPEAATVVTTVLELAKALDLSVVAEGIENERQLDFLKQHGCSYVQGFHLGMPMTARAARDFMLPIKKAASA
jgi:diguanylate cyclase (GGDEF)-like protein/PAS domain S-box-containing protein